MEQTFDYGERGLVRVVDDAAELAQGAVDEALRVVAAAQARRGWAHVALSGGSTPKQMGELLARDPYRDLTLWHDLHVYWGDERWVPLESNESNAGVAKRAFLDYVPIPAAQVHPFDTERRTPEESAAHYGDLLYRLLPVENDRPRLDLLFLGMGDDGHTASLFPHTTPIHETGLPVVAHDVPKLGVTRLTMTPPVLNAARHIVFLVAGGGKADRLVEVLEGPFRPDELPAQVIRPSDGELLWLVDRPAAAKLAHVREAHGG